MPGLKLVPDAALADAPQLDVLHIPGGFGQEALMEDEEVLGWIRATGEGRPMRFRRLHRRADLRCGGSDQRPAKPRRDVKKRRVGSLIASA